MPLLGYAVGPMDHIGPTGEFYDRTWKSPDRMLGKEVSGPVRLCVLGEDYGRQEDTWITSQ